MKGGVYRMLTLNEPLLLANGESLTVCVTSFRDTMI